MIYFNFYSSVIASLYILWLVNKTRTNKGAKVHSIFVLNVSENLLFKNKKNYLINLKPYNYYIILTYSIIGTYTYNLGTVIGFYDHFV